MHRWIEQINRLTKSVKGSRLLELRLYASLIQCEGVGHEVAGHSVALSGSLAGRCAQPLRPAVAVLGWPSSLPIIGILRICVLTIFDEPLPAGGGGVAEMS